MISSATREAYVRHKEFRCCSPAFHGAKTQLQACLDQKEVNAGCDAAFAPSFSPLPDFLAWVCTDTTNGFSLNLQKLSDHSTRRSFLRRDGIGGIAWSSEGRRIVTRPGHVSSDCMHEQSNRCSPEQTDQTHRCDLDREMSEIPSADWQARIAWLRATEEPLDPGHHSR